MIRLYATGSGLTLERDGAFSSIPDLAAIDRIFRADDAHGEAASLFDRGSRTQASDPSRPPLVSQEVWAAGLTYYLMTGTGIVPPDAFTLAAGDEIRITLEPVGTLVNTVAPPHA